MKIPDDPDFLTALILQRTRPFIDRVGKQALAHWTRTGDTSGLLLALGPRQNVAAYAAAAVEEIALDVEQYLEAVGSRRVRRLVSIGCGNGIAEAILCRALEVDAVLLVDIEHGGRGHGFAQDAAGYGDLDRAEDFLRENGVECKIEKWNPSTQREPAFRFDLLVSMYAMGFHFPAETYAGFIERNRNPGALVIHDGRQGRVVRGA